MEKKKNIIYWRIKYLYNWKRKNSELNTQSNVLVYIHERNPSIENYYNIMLEI